MTKAESRKLEAGRRVLAAASGSTPRAGSFDDTGEDSKDSEREKYMTPCGLKRHHKMSKSGPGMGA